MLPSVSTDSTLLLGRGFSRTHIHDLRLPKESVEVRVVTGGQSRCASVTWRLEPDWAVERFRTSTSIMELGGKSIGYGDLSGRIPRLTVIL